MRLRGRQDRNSDRLADQSADQFIGRFRNLPADAQTNPTEKRAARLFFLLREDPVESGDVPGHLLREPGDIPFDSLLSPG